MRRIEVLVFPDAQLLDVTGPLQVFASANELLEISGKPPAYEPMLVGRERQVRTCSGVVVACRELPGPETPLDTMIVPGGKGTNAACEDRRLVDWIVRRSGKARRTVSVCSGALLLATGGLLDGRSAATHWVRCAELARKFPLVRVEPDPVFVRDGNIWTSAGVTAGIDLALSLIEDDLGRPMALAVARELVVFLKRPGGQAQFSTTLALQHGDERFERLHAWIVENLRGDLSLPRLAERAGLSPRSFSRHYAKSTGRTPARAVEELRIETARRLLEEGMPVGQVSRRCGFGSEETMRRGFLRRLGATPKEYSERF